MITSLPKRQISRRRFRLRVSLPALVLVLSVAAPAHAQNSATLEGDEGGDDEVAVPSIIGGSISNTEATEGNPDRDAHPITDWLWGLPVIIDNPEAPLLQRFRFTGRYHWQHARVDSNQNDYDQSETRRARFGMNMKLLKTITIQSVWKLDGDNAMRDKENIDNQWISWRPREEFGIKLGQQKPLWSQEWSTSSNSMITMERALLVNQLRPRNSLGAYVSGTRNRWAYGAGWFRGDLGSDSDSSGDFYLLSLGRDIDDWFNVLEDARWRVDYMYNDGSGQAGSGEYRHSVATSISGKWGHWRWMGEGMYAKSVKDDRDVYGLVLMPSIDIIEDQLQFVLRYQLAGSEGDSLRLQDRYEIAGGPIGDASGDRYQAIYGGLNWYLRGNRFKLMSGLEYSDMNDPNNNGGDYHGWTLISGVRISF